MYERGKINWLVRKIMSLEREETIGANEWEERRFQRRFEVGRERMKLLLLKGRSSYTYQ